MNFRASKYSKIVYDIRTSYKLFLNYLFACTLKCSVKNYDNKTQAYTSMKNIMITQDNPLVKTLPLICNEEIVGNLQLSFNLQTFSDTTFDDDIKSLTQFGIQNEVLNSLNNREYYDYEIFKSKKNIRPNSTLSSKTNRSKDELACDYLMGK